MAKLEEIITVLNQYAPPNYQESWDNSGLQVGRLNSEVKRVFLALTPSSDVIERAKEKKADLIITHHPLIFKGLKTITDKTFLGDVIMSLAEDKMALFSAHTNFDITIGGVNDVLARALEVSQLEVLEKTIREKLYKLVVFVPKTHLENVRSALFSAGAGEIGNYSECSFSTNGIGSFMAKEGANPFVGKIASRHYEEETRLELLVRESDWQRVKQALLESHPYEEIAYDLFLEQDDSIDYGLGKIGNLSTPMYFSEYVKKISAKLGLSVTKVVGENKLIKRIAFCGGSGSSMITLAKNRGADCFLTGDLKYHDGQLAAELGLNLVDITHFAGEKIAMQAMGDHLKEAFTELDIILDEAEKDFFYVM